MSFLFPCCSNSLLSQWPTVYVVSNLYSLNALPPVRVVNKHNRDVLRTNLERGDITKGKKFVIGNLSVTVFMGMGVV